MGACSSNWAKGSVNPGTARFVLAMNVFGESAEDRTLPFQLF